MGISSIQLRQLRDMVYASEMMGSGYGWCLRALAGACRPEVVDMLTGGGEDHHNHSANP